jgi:outer membrane protein assembly factor BamB
VTSFLDPRSGQNDVDDKDFGSGRVLLIPGVDRVVSAGKDSALWLLTSSMGFVQGFNLVYGGSGHFGGQTYINGAEYIGLRSGPINRLAFDGEKFPTDPIVTAASFDFPGAQLSSSSNGPSETIVWALTREASTLDGKRPVKLRAFRGTTLAELYQSDSFGDTAKFSAPTVANGKVYAGTLDGFVAVFGLLP